MTTAPSHAHDRLVELTAKHMVSQGFTSIRASHIARFTACDQIGDYIPDATAFVGGVFVVAEAESHDGLVQAHTEAQWKTFHSYASRYGGRFVAVVNKSDEAAARTLLVQVCGNSANARVWTF